MIEALHGFLGSGSDWDFLRRAGFEVEAPDLFAEAPLAESMETWADQFLEDTDRRNGVILTPATQTLLGYSLGGRLALHTLLADQQQRFTEAVIVSAGLGIEGEAARTARKIADDRWASRFESEPWDTVIRDWNAQPIFGGRENANLRLESALDRQALAAALRDWSPAVHPPLAERLHDISARVLWIAGEDDPKYVAEGRRAVERLPNAELWICPDAGHRVPWEQPARFIERLHSFLEERD
jgi:2-succinyl-6-hydroxy-2,4-cyclohexadiene-1-carboxylate synthase